MTHTHRVRFVHAVVWTLLLAGALWWLRPIWRDLLLYQPAVGDVVFQSLPPNALVTAIEGITDSPYSHCGIIDQIDGQWVMVEALGTVHTTPLRQWLLRGRGAAVSVGRYAFAPNEAQRVLAAVHTFDGRPYDIRYKDDDAKLYCSELVAKGFRGIGIELGTWQRLGDLRWQPYEATIVHFEQGPVPLDRRMVTPVSLAHDRRLVPVFDSY